MNPRSETALAEHAPLFAEARGDIAVSFEFFPPKSEAMAATLWQSIETLAPLEAALRQRDLRGRRLDPRADPPDGRADRQGNPADRRRAPHLRRCQPRRGRCRGALLLGRRGAPHRRAARRSARGRPRLRPAPSRLCQCGGAGRGAQEGRAVRHFGRLLSRGPSRGELPRGRPRQFQAQGRCRRRPRDQPVLLFRRQLLPLPRPRRRRRHGRSRSSPESCRSPTSPPPASSPASAARRSPAGWTRCSTGSTRFPPRGS